MVLSSCGLVCSDCEYYPVPCSGCGEVKGQPFWVTEADIDVCLLFHCCAEKQINSCGACDNLPCKKFLEIKDPNMTLEEHREEVVRRVERLKKAGLE